MSKQISAVTSLMSYQGKTLLIDWSYSITGTNWKKKCVPSVLSYVDYLSYILTPDNALKGILGSGLPCYLQDLQHMVPHWLCSKPAYWLIWVISEANVTNLCRKCCNWISATRIMWSSSQECIWKPQCFADSGPTLFLERPSNPAPSSTFTTE